MRLKGFIAIVLLIFCPILAAKDAVPRSIKIAGAEAGMQIAYAEKAMRQNDLDTALTHVQSAVQLDPKAAETHIALAVVSARRGDNQQAAQSFSKAIKLNKQNFSAWYHQAEWQCAMRNAESAFKSYKQSFTANFQASPPAAYVSAINCAIQHNKLDVAGAFAEQGLQRFPTSSPLLISMAVLQYQQQDYLRARAFLQRAEALTTLDRQALQLAARIEQKAGDQAASKRYQSKLAQLQDEEPESPGELTHGH